MKRLTLYVAGLLLGMVMILSGIYHLFLTPEPEVLSDRQIIERARDLGMVPVTELYRQEEGGTHP